MSLLTGASLWQNDDTNKKRISTMKKPEKLASYNEVEENLNKYGNSTPATIDDLNKSNEMKSNRVSELINKMTSINVDNDGNKLSNFTPIQNPEMTNIREDPSNQKRFDAPPMRLPGQQSMGYEKPNFSSQSLSSQNFSSNDSNLANLSNYRNVYQQQPSSVTTKPYYSNMGIHTGTDNKLLEKINYMIHLLEEQQSEKTNNITEEFILYTFFGVFIIYVLDSFARTGKYIR
jgi:hypothetical protein